MRPWAEGRSYNCTLNTTNLFREKGCTLGVRKASLYVCHRARVREWTFFFETLLNSKKTPERKKSCVIWTPNEKRLNYASVSVPVSESAVLQERLQVLFPLVPGGLYVRHPLSGSPLIAVVVQVQLQIQEMMKI